MIELPAHPDPEATIIVLGLREAPHLLGCLDAVARSSDATSSEVRIVLCDPSARLASQVQSEVRGAYVASFRANLGFAASVNFAAARSRGQFIVLLNDDTLVQDGWLDPLVDTVQQGPRRGMVAGTLLHPDGTLQESGSVIWSDGSTNAVGDGLGPRYMAFERRIDYASAGLLLVRREVWSELEGMDESFYPAYFEDVDFCLRAAKAGWECWYQPASMAFHNRSSSTNPTLRGFLFDRGHECFLERWGEALANHEERGDVEAAVWSAMGRPTRVLVIDDLIPDPKVGSGQGRMYDALSVMASEDDIQVSFFPTIRPTEDVRLFPVPRVRLIEDLEHHLRTDGVAYEVVIVSRPHNVPLVRELIDQRLPGARIVYDAEALFHKRLIRQAALANDDAEREALLRQADAMREIEVSAADWADRVTCISIEEAAEMRQLTSTHVDVIGPALRLPRPTESDFADRGPNIGLVAGWAAGPGSPNSDGLLWFGREVYPRIRARLPQAHLKVTGAMPPDELAWLARSGIEFVGKVPDLWSFYDRIRLAISPTRFGAGVKLKTIEAIQYGVPVVCTSEAASGLPLEARSSVWVTDDPDLFASAVVELLSDSQMWARLRASCLSFAEVASNREDGVQRWAPIVRASEHGSMNARRSDTHG